LHNAAPLFFRSRLTNGSAIAAIATADGVGEAINARHEALLSAASSGVTRERWRKAARLRQGAAPTQTLSRCARGKALAQRGELEAAEELLREADDLAAATEFPSLQATVLLSLAEVLTEAGKPDEAAAAAAQAEEILSRKGNTAGARLAATFLSATAA